VAWDNADAGTIWTLADITAERDEREQLQWTASHDGLTGLANRAVLTRQLDELLASRASATPSALLLMDLDRFKPINDGHGHAAGDAMLRAVALAIGGCVRSGDVVARLGGDEFGVVLLQCPADVAQRVAESICQQVAALRLPWQGQQLHVGISVGVAALAEEVDSVASWLARADAACYEAKAAGRGSVKVAGSTAARHALRLVSGDKG
jgi:diguanylate cyclase (GGDEF)-like protein